MRVLIVITNGNIGGATNFVFWLAKGLKEKGIKVFVGFGEGNYLKEKLEKEKIPYFNFKWLKRTLNPLSNLFFIFEMKKFLERENFDVVHFNSTNALFGAIGVKTSKKKIKTIFTFHGLSILDPNYKKKFFLKPIYFLIFKFLLNFVDVPVFVSKQNLEWAKKIKLIKNGQLIYNGIPEPNFFPRKNARKFIEEKIGINLKEKFVIGSVGRLDYQKNYEFLIKVFSKVLKIKEEALLIIVGEGPKRKELEKLIKKLNIKERVFLLGEIEDASKYLKGFDVFILPSRYEGLSITLIEVLFARIPVLATNVGGNVEILSEDSIFKLNDEKDLLEKLKSCSIPKDNRERFILKKTVENYYRLLF